MVDAIRRFLVSLDYGDDYILLWAGASVAFLVVSLGPALVYLLFFSDIDKSVKTAMRSGSSRQREEASSHELTKSRGPTTRRRKKRLVSRRMLLVHTPAFVVLLALGFAAAYGLTRLFSSI